MTETLVLGTASKRRIDLLKQFNLPFQQATSYFDEDSIPLNLKPDEYVKQIALGKAKTLASQFPKQPILTADTTVFFENTLYGKPKNDEEAFATLKKFRGKWHEVWTGLCLSWHGKFFCEVEKTAVLFNQVSDEALLHYINVFNPLDKAGSYAIQDAAGLLVNRIDGDFYNVIGFPLTRVASILKHAGIDLWSLLKKPPSFS